jgi:crotonobetainyl-CoA:carnitine CoA-transferase CaiB-like acyl-CoA transferase
MCGLMLGFIVAAALWQRRRTGQVARVDFSMMEAMLWTMAEPLLAAQLGTPPRPVGNLSSVHAPHAAYRCAGNDAWIGVAVTNDAEWRNLCAVVPELAPLVGLDARERVARRDAIDSVLGAWLRSRDSRDAAAEFLRAGVPSSALATSVDLVDCAHLRERGFWGAHGAGVLPGLPWRASFGRATGAAPELGADTEAVLREVLGQTPSGA